MPSVALYSTGFSRLVALRGPLTALLLVALVSGCGAATAPARSVQELWRATPSNWFVEGQSNATFIAWVDEGAGRITGSLQSATQSDDSAGEPIKSFTVAFSGTVRANAVSLVVAQFLGTNSTWTGSVSANELTLNMPQVNGSIAPIIFAPGTVSDFNSAVSKMSATVTQNRAAAASAEADNAAAAASAEASDVAAALLAEAETQLSNAVSVLRGALADGISFAGFETDITALKSDLQTTISAATAAKAEGSSNLSACSDAGGAQADAGGVEADKGSIEADAGGAQAIIDSVNAKEKDVRDKLEKRTAAYQAQSLVPPVFDGSQGSDLFVKKASAIASWTAKVQSYSAKASDLSAQATAVADSAYRAVC